MIYKYLKRAIEAAKERYMPKHPNPQRFWTLPDGSVVVADSYDDVEMDSHGNFKPAPSITDMIKADQTKTMGSLATPTIFSAAEFSQKFLRQFSVAGERDRAAIEAKKAAAVAAAAPAPEPTSENVE